MAEPLELRCFCRRHPLLALAGRDSKTGTPYVQVKAYRQERIFAEVYIVSGTSWITCRECLRRHRITIRTERVDFSEEQLPESVDENLRR